MFWALAGHAVAGAWPAQKGEGQIILKADSYRADVALNAEGNAEPLIDPIQLKTLDLWGEYGLTSQITTEFQGRLSQGQIGPESVQGIDTVRIGLRASLLPPNRTIKLAMGLYREWPGKLGVSETLGIKAREAVTEMRFLVGASKKLKKQNLTAEIQVAERWSDKGIREHRQDLTLILSHNSRHQFVSQLYKGARQEPTGRAQWLTQEVSYLQACGRWRCQIGVRKTLSGRNTPKGDAVLVGIWARF
ncbi:MAG: hypothetical protein ACK41P_02085 [Asticcacaulis sp.]